MSLLTIVCYLMANRVYTYIFDIYNLVWFGLVGFYGISTIVCYLMPNLVYIYIQYIGFGFVGFYGISTIVRYLMPNLVYIYIQYMGFGLVGFYGISTIVCYLMPNLVYIYIQHIGFDLVGLYGISIIVDYLMPNFLYTCIWIWIRGNVDKSNSYKEFRSNISFFIYRIRWRSINKERNITTKLVVSVKFIHFSTYSYRLVRFTKIYNFSILSWRP